MSRNTRYGLIAGLILLWAGLVCGTAFVGPDQPIYFAYTASFVEDGDLNVVNQHVAQKEAVPVTGTWNYPDYHNHGGVLFWAPFYAYGMMAFDWANRVLPGSADLPRVLSGAMSFCTLLLGTAALLLMFLLGRHFMPLWASAVSVAVVALGTPYFFFWLSETGNGQIPISLLSVISVACFSRAASMDERQYFWYGVFFSMSTVVKIDLTFQVVFVGLYFGVLLGLGLATWRKGLCLALGMAPPALLKIANDTIKYGVVRQGELSLLNFKSFYFLDQMFSSYHGFLYTSPVLLVCLVGVAVLVRRAAGANNGAQRLPALMLLCLSAALGAKLFTLSFRYAWGGGTPGARILLSEFPLYVLLFGTALTAFRSVAWRAGLLALSAALVLWNLMVIGEYITGVDLDYLAHAPPLAVRVPNLAAAFGVLTQARDLGFKLLYWAPLLPLLFGLPFALRLGRPILAGRMFDPSLPEGRLGPALPRCAAVMLAAYAGVTALNGLNNEAKADSLRACGCLDGCVRVSRTAFENDENLGSFDEMIVYNTLRGNWPRAQSLLAQRREYAARTTGEHTP